MGRLFPGATAQDIDRCALHCNMLVSQRHYIGRYLPLVRLQVLKLVAGALTNWLKITLCEAVRRDYDRYHHACQQYLRIIGCLMQHYWFN